MEHIARTYFDLIVGSAVGNKVSLGAVDCFIFS